MRTLTIKEEAYQDIFDAIDWYKRQSHGLGDDFWLAFNKCCTYILNFPEAFPGKYKNYRQAFMRRFPYVVIYEFTDPDIIIYSVFFTDRDPQGEYPD